MNLPEPRLFTVVSRSDLAQGVFSLTLAPADGEPVFSFLPGHWIMLHLLNPDGTTRKKAAFSIASAPSESTKTIELGIKIRGELTTAAAKFEKGDQVKVQGPYGAFFLQNAPEPLVLIAGGIGITPFRSMVREACLQKSQRDIRLFYSDRTQSEMAYEKELRGLAKECPNFKPTFILTRESPETWDGETGHLSADMLKRSGADLSRSDYMACGSLEFVQHTQDVLKSLGVDLKTKFKQESF